jgi:hypothetical protein
VEWAAEVPAVAAGVLVAVEWLDVVPVDQVELTERGHRLVEVAPDGASRWTQREALRLLGVSGARPAYGGDPGGYLRGLADAGAAAELLDPAGLGGFTWLVQWKGCRDPLAGTG